MSKGVSLEEEDWLRFASAVDGSFNVINRQQFFVWTQSSVQGLIPHQILLCAVRSEAGAGLMVEYFSASRYFKAEHFQVVADPVSGLLKHLGAASDPRESAVLLCPKADADAGPLGRLVAANELQNLAAMAIFDVNGQVEAYYAFGRVDAPLDLRLKRLLELMVPHLHATFVPILARERDRDGAGRIEASAERIITRRQEEILRLIKDGKTNAQIADVLECSQWTIKNHIQNIMKRLNTNSRAHALVVAMRKGILRPD